jgi:anti-sigma regulatory factor (Ser/Thr protein kinase)
MSSVLELRLDSQPRSVGEARAWVVSQLRSLGREDLVDAARLGVSELVTNAILHADPPILLRLGGTPAHPRVEVHDHSGHPPTVRDMTDGERLLATIGRGLSIVATYSTTWGAETSADGKVVWFEPAREEEVSEDGRPTDGEVFDMAGLAELLAEERPVEKGFRVRLLGMPVRVFAHFRLWYDELRRELRLLAMAHGSEYAVAQELTDLTVQVDRERRQARGVSRLDEAIRSGDDRVDLVYDCPASAATTMARLSVALTRADAFCREQGLLAASATPQLVQLWTWYLGEFERQARGEQPRPWPGSYAVTDDPTP